MPCDCWASSQDDVWKANVFVYDQMYCQIWVWMSYRFAGNNAQAGRVYTCKDVCMHFVCATYSSIKLSFLPAKMSFLMSEWGAMLSCLHRCSCISTVSVTVILLVPYGQTLSPVSVLCRGDPPHVRYLIQPGTLLSLLHSECCSTYWYIECNTSGIDVLMYNYACVQDVAFHQIFSMTVRMELLFELSPWPSMEQVCDLPHHLLVLVHACQFMPSLEVTPFSVPDMPSTNWYQVRIW